MFVYQRLNGIEQIPTTYLWLKPSCFVDGDNNRLEGSASKMILSAGMLPEIYGETTAIRAAPVW